MRLRNYGKWSKVKRIIESNNNKGKLRERDSKQKKLRSRTESSLRDSCYPSVINDSIKKFRRRGEFCTAGVRSNNNQLKSSRVHQDVDCHTIRKGYLSDNAVMKSLRGEK